MCINYFDQFLITKPRSGLLVSWVEDLSNVCYKVLEDMFRMPPNSVILISFNINLTPKNGNKKTLGYVGTTIINLLSLDLAGITRKRQLFFQSNEKL